jgi:hypothetical protein
MPQANNTPLSETELAELRERWRKLPASEGQALITLAQQEPGDGSQQRRLYELTKEEKPQS